LTLLRGFERFYLVRAKKKGVTGMGIMTFLKTSIIAAVTVVATAPIGSAYSGENYVVCKLNPNGDNFLALRSCGSTKCRIVRKLPPDTFLLTMEPYAEKHWREVMVVNGLQDQSYSGATGWVYDKYICKIVY